MPLAKIQLSSFSYKKRTGETSDRSAVIVEETDDRVLVLEVVDGDLTTVQPYLAYVAELEELKAQLKVKHGLDKKKLPFKSFLLAGIKDRKDQVLSINL